MQTISKSEAGEWRCEDIVGCTCKSDASPISWNVLACGTSYLVSDTDRWLIQSVARGDSAVAGSMNTWAYIVPLRRAAWTVVTLMLLCCHHALSHSTNSSTARQIWVITDKTTITYDNFHETPTSTKTAVFKQFLPCDATQSTVLLRQVVFHPSVRDVEVSWSHRLEIFKNNFTVSSLVCSLSADITDLFQRKFSW